MYDSPPLEQSFADYREGDQVTITPKAARLFEVVRVTDEGMQVAALGGDGAENLQWVVSLDHVRLIRRPDPEPSTGHGPACDHDKDDAGLYALDNGDVNILLSLAGIKRLQLQRELRGADQKTREEIIQYDMDPAHLDRIIAKLRRQA